MIISPRLNISFLKNFKVFIDAGYGSSGKPFTFYSEENKRNFLEIGTLFKGFHIDIYTINLGQ